MMHNPEIFNLKVNLQYIHITLLWEIYFKINDYIFESFQLNVFIKLPKVILRRKITNSSHLIFKFMLFILQILKPTRSEIT